MLMYPQSGLQMGIKMLFIKAFSLEGIEDIAVLGLPLAVSISTIFQFILMLVFLKKRIENLNLKEISNSFLKILLASVLMIVSVSFILSATSPIFSSQTLGDELLKIVIVGLTGCLVYFWVTFTLNSPEITTFKALLLKKFSPET